MIAALHPLLLLICQASSSANPLLGLWRSSEARTHEEIRKVSDSLTDKQKAFLLRPGFFGKMVYFFQKDRVVVAFDGECKAPVSYRLNVSKDGDVQLLLFHPTGENVLVKMRFDGTELSLNVGRDVFPELNSARHSEVLPAIAL